MLVGTVLTAPASLVQRLRAFEGLYISPFREKLLFAKTSFQPGPGQQAEITYNWRNETDIRGFGGQGASNSTRQPRTCTTAWTRSRASGRSPVPAS